MGDAERRLTNSQGWITFDAQVVHLATHLTQTVHQVADGALVHAGNALQGVVATQQRQGCGERAHGRASVAHEESQRVLMRGTSPQPVDRDARALDIDATAQLAQGLQHDACVVRVEQVVDMRRAFAQR